MENLHILVGKNLRFYRLKKGYSQEQLAELCGLHRTYIGGIERGERNITLQTLQVLANSLDISPVDLIIGKRDNV